MSSDNERNDNIMGTKTHQQASTDFSLGKRLQTARHMAHMTQDALAQKLYISRSGWANYENNTRTPSIATLQKAAETLGISLSYLLGDKKNVDILAQHCSFASDYLTKDGHLDLSKESSMTKIIVIEFYLFIREKYKDELPGK